GLEFPVVFLCECAKRRNDQDERRTVLFDDALGFGMQLPDSTGLVKCDNLIRRSIAAKMADESKEEEMRMLYVALTRARSKLIVTAKVNHADRWLEEKRAVREFADGWCVKKASSYIDWIGLAVSRGQSRSWQVEVIDAADLMENDTDSFLEDKVTASVDASLLAELTERTQFEYAYGFLAGIPSKLVVSRLDPEILDEETSFELNTVPDSEPAESDPAEESTAEKRLPKRPSFMTGGEDIRANEIGSATHRFLQFADFSNMASCGWERELERLIERKFLSARDGEIVNKSQLEKFLSSKLFADLSASSMVKREFRFNVLVDASEFTAEPELKKKLAENGVKLTVQGVVDCVYRSPSTGKLILIDYKTDSVRSDEWRDIKKAERRLADRHRNQLTYYTKICSDLFGEEISETAIYSTVLGRCIKVK
ncbi:MAG: PD-(D/E)XK nuclease family protein, partial [Clostridia bacterium]|nr:PD-(D/E)XK nuclease family protein [Clostridia bacterium]